MVGCKEEEFMNNVEERCYNSLSEPEIETSKSLFPMAQSIQQIETEIVALRASIQAVDKEVQQVIVAINEAEKHVLEDDKVHIWEPKLSSLRQDKVFLLKKEDNLHKEMVVLWNNPDWPQFNRKEVSLSSLI